MLNPAILSYIKNPVAILKNISWRLTKRTSDKRHIFILGAPRSGTTLLQVLLTGHDELGGTMGETGTFTKQNLFDMNRQHGRLADSVVKNLFSNSNDIIEFFDNLSTEILKKYGGNIFVEKTPQHILKLSYLLKHFPNSDFIHIYRDGRDCFCSARNNKNIPQHSTVTRYAKYWKNCIQSRMRINSNRVLDVSYENLTSNTEHEVKQIMSHLNLKFSPEQIDCNKYSKDVRSSQKTLSKLASPIDNKSTDRWKTEMNEEENKIYIKVGAKEQEYLGYPLS
ncbi:MAG: sulfotransferase [Methylococcales bacterium]